MDAGPVNSYVWMHAMLIDIAVEDFSPKSRYRKTQIIAPPGAFREGRYNYNVVSDAFEPPMKSKHAVAVRAVKWVDLVTAQSRLICTKPDQILCEAQVINGVRIAIKAIPFEQIGTARVRVPRLIFEEFLTHKKLRNARRRK